MVSYCDMTILQVELYARMSSNIIPDRYSKDMYLFLR